MGILDLLLIGVILLAVFGALRVCIKNHRQGKHCGGNCAHCDHHCGK